MIPAAFALFIIAFLISLAGTWLARRYAHRLGLIDAPGLRKVHTLPTPRNGGIGIFCGFAIPIILGLITITALGHVADHALPHRYDDSPIAHAHDTYLQIHFLGIAVPQQILLNLPGMREHLPLAIMFLAATFLIHTLGLLDDHKPMRPWPKLLAQLAIAAALVCAGETTAPGGFRILTILGNFPAPGFFLSALISVAWIVALTNAFNFLDHMDGLSAGVAFICAAMFLIAAVYNQQWFICVLLLLYLGSILGFLCFNFPPATIFMGDGGSMILGFILSVLTIRTTYHGIGARGIPGGKWYAVFMPLFVMAVPLYDLVIVSVLRILKGRSPMQGDTNHFSHRLTRHGFSKRGAVLLIYGLTLATGVTAPLLARVDDTSAILLAAQLLGILVVIGILERVGEHTT